MPRLQWRLPARRSDNDEKSNADFPDSADFYPVCPPDSPDPRSNLHWFPFWQPRYDLATFTRYAEAVSQPGGRLT